MFIKTKHNRQPLTFKRIIECLLSQQGSPKRYIVIGTWPSSDKLQGLHCNSSKNAHISTIKSKD